MIVYLITNTINGKRYIGQTSLTLGERWSLHKSRHSQCTAIKSAIDKYGFSNFEISILFDDLTKELADEFEKEYIVRYNSHPPYGYNLTDGGDGLFNPSQEIRKRLSDANKGNKNAVGAIRSPEYLNALSKRFKGVPFSEEHKKKLSEAAGNRRASEETKAKLSAERKQRGIRPPKLTTEELAQAGRISGHKRYHVNRNIVNPKCLLCREGSNSNVIPQ
jgi:group I intron endonuclease